MTPIRVKTRRINNLYVLLIYAPGSGRKVVLRRVEKRPFPSLAVGDVLRDGRRRLCVSAVEHRIERRDEVIEHLTEVFTRKTSKRRTRRNAMDENVVGMPAAGNSSAVVQFIRFHVLVRVYHGNPDAWLADLNARGETGGDVRFVRWIRSRLRRDPALMASIRRMVAATPFWRVTSL